MIGLRALIVIRCRSIKLVKMKTTAVILVVATIALILAQEVQSKPTARDQNCEAMCKWKARLQFHGMCAMNRARCATIEKCNNCGKQLFNDCSVDCSYKKFN